MSLHQAGELLQTRYAVYQDSFIGNTVVRPPDYAIPKIFHKNTSTPFSPPQSSNPTNGRTLDGNGISDSSPVWAALVSQINDYRKLGQAYSRLLQPTTVIGCGGKSGVD